MALERVATTRTVRDYERQFVRDVIDNLSASVAGGMREGDGEFVESGETLTPQGLAYVRGYLTGRLSMLRGGSIGNPNLSEEDVEELTAIVEENEAAVAAELYS